MPSASAPEPLPDTIEGTWEEISRQADKLSGHRLRVTILPGAAAQAQEEPAALDAENVAAIAYLQERLQNVPTDPDRVRQAEAELEELHQNLNKNRIEAGERPLFPE
jgi:hypothetical protein